MKGYSQNKIDLVMEKLPSLYSEAFDLPVGQLLVIGVPKSMKNFVYDSTSYGIPTGKSLSHLSNQVRIILSDKILKSEEITVTNAMNFEEVQKQCNAFAKEDVEQCMISIFQTAQPKSTEQEKTAIERYSAFINTVNQLTKEYLSGL